ncbi:MAG: hypothetical protein Q4C56_03085 [Peptococcaceae bacterium]|nr:hypothetical protein [Peptococcaceae bacterium]
MGMTTLFLATYDAGVAWGYIWAILVIFVVLPLVIVIRSHFSRRRREMQAQLQALSELQRSVDSLGARLDAMQQAVENLARTDDRQR